MHHKLYICDLNAKKFMGRSAGVGGVQSPSQTPAQWHTLPVSALWCMDPLA